MVALYYLCDQVAGREWKWATDVLVHQFLTAANQISLAIPRTRMVSIVCSVSTLDGANSKVAAAVSYSQCAMVMINARTFLPVLYTVLRSGYHYKQAYCTVNDSINTSATVLASCLLADIGLLLQIGG